MSTGQPQMTARKALSILWFPIFFAVVLPVTFEVAYEQQTPHHITIAAVGSASQVTRLTDELHRVANGFVVRKVASAGSATAAVRDRKVDAAYVAGATDAVYVARAASAIGASYLQGVFTRIAAETGRPAPPVVDLVAPASGDGGTGIFFFVFPLMMSGLITAIVLLQLPTWGVGRRVGFVLGVGVVGALATYLTAVGLDVLPAKPLLLVYAFVLTQVYGQLMVGASHLLKQYFLPVSLSLALILSVPSSSATLPLYLLPAFFRDLSYVLPLAQGVKATRGVAYFHDVGIAQATLILGLWVVIAAVTVGVAWLRQSSAPRTGERRNADTNVALRSARTPAPSAT